MSTRLSLEEYSELLQPPRVDRFRVAIVGGGAAGTLLALHLQNDPTIEVALYDRDAAFGRGVAYGARAPWHRLNVPAVKMGGWHADDDSGFARWLAQRQGGSCLGAERHYAERSEYGDWLSELLQPLIVKRKVLPVAREVVDIAPAARGDVILRLDDGLEHPADAVVLCHGNASVCPLASVPSGPRHIPQVWHPDALVKIPLHEDVLVVGTGASGVDAVLELLHRGHRGAICMVSKRGLLPRPEAMGATHPDFLVPGDGTKLRQLLASTREEVRRAMASGAHWQSVMDVVMRQADDLWTGLSERERAQFVRHVRPFWMSCRHRANPDVLETLNAAEAAGQLRILAARLQTAEVHGKRAVNSS